MRKSLRAIPLLVLAAITFPAAADITFSVVSDVTKAQPIAVAPFAQPADVTVDLAQVISADLDRSGLFRALPRSDMLEKPTDVSQINLRNWRAVGVDDLVVGTVTADPSGPGKILASFRLVSVQGNDDPTQAVVLSMDNLPAADAKHWRRLAHQIADQIYQKLTGVRGIFDTRIAYVTSTGFGDRQRFMMNICDADGENHQGIAISHEPLGSPAWSPDGKRLAYVGYQNHQSGIYIQDVDAGVLVGGGPVLKERGINGAPAWSPDGTKLAVTLSYETNPDIYIFDLATRSLHRITTDSAIDTEANWSPDGRTLAFLSDRGGQPQIYTVPAGGGPQTRLTFEGTRNEDPRYSPDGKTMALVNSGGSGFHIGLLDLQKHSLRAISEGPRDFEPNFAPNGQFVVYTAQGPGGSDVLATTSVDGRIRQIISDQGNVKDPSWSPFRSPSD